MTRERIEDERRAPSACRLRSALGRQAGEAQNGDTGERGMVKNGDRCLVTGGSHAGKSGMVEDRNTSKTGHVTITVRQADGTRFKTLARNVVVRP
jgi:hypothetical protein